MTEWREVEGSPGYMVSDEGRVRSPRGTLLRPQRNGPYGYRRVAMTRARTEYVHRLVAAAFLGAVDGMDVEHADGDVANNHVANLAIVTHAENMRLQRNRKPLCKRGHAFAEDGGWTRGGRRYCKACMRERDAARYRSRK